MTGRVLLLKQRRREEGMTLPWIPGLYFRSVICGGPTLMGTRAKRRTYALSGVTACKCDFAPASWTISANLFLSSQLQPTAEKNCSGFLINTDAQIALRISTGMAKRIRVDSNQMRQLFVIDVIAKYSKMRQLLAKQGDGHRVSDFNRIAVRELNSFWSRNQQQPALSLRNRRCSPEYESWPSVEPQSTPFAGAAHH
uniref:Uncharacterized protein n=1 Tax=Ascaris lumbricoides TaxID=6252 RepID=A0A0M3HNT6_ASCLU